VNYQFQNAWRKILWKAFLANGAQFKIADPGTMRLGY
jgi:hypothetical protein